MVTLMIIGILGVTVGFAAYELIHEIHDGHKDLHDRYHE